MRKISRVLALVSCVSNLYNTEPPAYSVSWTEPAIVVILGARRDEYANKPQWADASYLHLMENRDYTQPFIRDFAQAMHNQLQNPPVPEAELRYHNYWVNEFKKAKHNPSTYASQQLFHAIVTAQEMEKDWPAYYAKLHTTQENVDVKEEIRNLLTQVHDKEAVRLWLLPCKYVPETIRNAAQKRLDELEAC